MSDRSPYSSPLPEGQQPAPTQQSPAKKPWYKQTWLLVVAVIFALGVIGSLTKQPAPAPHQAEQSNKSSFSTFMDKVKDDAEKRKQEREKKKQEKERAKQEEKAKKEQKDREEKPEEIKQSEPEHKSAEPESPPVEPAKEEPASGGDVTSGGIDYAIAVQACDLAAQAQLFPGSSYDAQPVRGKQKGQIGLSEDQFLAVYNVNVDGHRTAITCLVDGAKDSPNVISVREFEGR